MTAKTRILTGTIITAALALQFGVSADWKQDYPWATDAVNYCTSTGILEGSDGDLMLDSYVTRSQMAKLVSTAFSLQDTGSNGFYDTDSSSWDFPYINAIEAYMPIKGDTFNGYEYISREEYAATIMTALGATDGDTTNLTTYRDYVDIDSRYRGAVASAVESDVLQGSDGRLNPKGTLTRAEACVILYRGVQLLPESQRPQATESSEKVISTDLIGDAQISVEQAKAWARSKGGTDKYVNIADTYWYYGTLTGLRPEILYAQAALETGYGNYGGVVTEDMNNWAGIKVAGRNDDAKEAHETFTTPEEGVRGHFNHVCAYVGLAPIGEPHARYWSVKSMSWAGTIRTLEEFSGKWCPDPEYASKIYEGCLVPMSQF